VGWVGPLSVRVWISRDEPVETIQPQTPADIFVGAPVCVCVCNEHDTIVVVRSDFIRMAASAYWQKAIMGVGEYIYKNSLGRK